MCRTAGRSRHGGWDNAPGADTTCRRVGGVDASRHAYRPVMRAGGRGHTHSGADPSRVRAISDFRRRHRGPNTAAAAAAAAWFGDDSCQEKCPRQICSRTSLAARAPDSIAPSM
ncbi:hypothetical protein GCM10010331_78230 [Streptomyces xanthochromogenes]|nr:hypothetical protein GCM10010331_78230 [Streptomyces xanthochromogenes]